MIVYDLNRNSIKISYSYMLNMKPIITGQNKKLLEKESSQQSKPCKCKNKNICPLKGSCRQQFIKQTYLMKILYNRKLHRLQRNRI